MRMRRACRTSTRLMVSTSSDNLQSGLSRRCLMAKTHRPSPSQRVFHRRHRRMLCLRPLIAMTNTNLTTSTMPNSMSRLAVAVHRVRTCLIGRHFIAIRVNGGNSLTQSASTHMPVKISSRCLRRAMKGMKLLWPSFSNSSKNKQTRLDMTHHRRRSYTHVPRTPWRRSTSIPGCKGQSGNVTIGRYSSCVKSPTCVCSALLFEPFVCVGHNH